MTRQEFVDAVYHIALTALNTQDAEARIGELYDRLMKEAKENSLQERDFRNNAGAPRPKNSLDGL